MAQAIDYIRRALVLDSVLDSDETPSATAAQDALDALNDMLADWSASENLLLFAPAQLSYTVPSSITSFSVGPSGADVTATRPTTIRDMFVRSGSVDFPVEQISAADYQAISLKSLVGGYPSVCWYEPTATNGTAHLWLGASAGQVVYFTAEQVLQSFATINSSVTLPANYARALVFNLAVEIAPQYGVEAPATVQRIASVAKRNIKRLNARVPNMQNEAGFLARRHTSGVLNIKRGY